MNSKGSSIVLNNINKSFVQGSSRVEVLKNIDLKFYPGKWYTLYGASGSGKTTFLNILGGIEKPDTGKYLYHDIDVYGMSDSRICRWRNLKIGFVFQLFYLISEISVKKNIVLPVSINNLKLDKDWFNNIIKILQIGRLLDRNISTLSGGEKQRVAIARAVINRPDYILADEPTGNLDSDNSKSVIDLMKKLQNESMVGIIMATHERDLVEIGEYKLFLKNGIIEFNED